MNQKGNAVLISTIVAVIVIGIGWAIYSQTQKSDISNQDNTAINDDVMMDDKNVKNDAMMDEDKTEDDTMMKDETSGDNMMRAEGGEYVSYQPALLSRADSGKVVLFFRASWCPTCKILDSSLRSSLDQIPDDLTILDVDYDNSSDLKNKYAITYQHTLVQVDANGNELAKWSGGSDLASIVSHLK